MLTAAGSGSRFGHAALPKALVPLGGEALVTHAARRLAASGVVREIVVTAPAGFSDEVGAAVRAGCTLAVRVVDGGASRQASVAAGLAALSGGHAVVLVHDAARPLASAGLVRRLVMAVLDGRDAVVPGLAVADTIKAVDDGEPPRAVSTLDRAHLRAIQTPQAFRAAVLRRAHDVGADRAGSEATAASDDAGLVEALGLDVHVIDGEPQALKITTAHDLAIAGLYLEENS